MEPEEQQDVMDQIPEVEPSPTENTGEVPEQEGEPTELPAEGEPSQETVVEPPEAVDENGVPYKNRYMELQRKFDDVPNIIRETVEKSLQQNNTNKQEYTEEHIPMLEQYAQENPQYANWAKAEINKIHNKSLQNIVRNELESYKREQTDAQIRQQSESWVTNHPEFKDCFVNVGGQKQWNMANPLSQSMAQILNARDPMTGKLVKDRPDGLAVAAEMAYGRMALSNRKTTSAKVTKLQREARKLQKQTMTPVGSQQSQSAKTPRDGVRSSLDNYNKSYNRKDIEAATRNFLAASGLIKEE